MKDCAHFAIWNYLLLNAVHSPCDVIFGGKRITLKSGEFTTGRNVIAKDLKISSSKVQRILKTFENEQQIEQVTDMKCRLIRVLKWSQYQESEQVSEQQVNKCWTSGEQVVNTKEECKNIKNERKGKKKNPINKKFIIPTVKEIQEYLDELKETNLDAEYFFDRNQSSGWKLKSGQDIKDWKAVVRTWRRFQKKFNFKPDEFMDSWILKARKGEMEWTEKMKEYEKTAKTANYNIK